MIQVNRIYLIFNRLVTKKFLVDTSANEYTFSKLEAMNSNGSISGSLYYYSNS